MRIPFYIHVANSVDSDENASFRLGLHCLADGTHLCPISITDSLIIFRKNTFVCSNDYGAYML